MGSRYYSCRLKKKRPKKGAKPPAKPKSFKTADAVRKWAEKNGVTKFTVEEAAPGKFKLRRKF